MLPFFSFFFFSSFPLFCFSYSTLFLFFHFSFLLLTCIDLQLSLRIIRESIDQMIQNLSSLDFDVAKQFPFEVNYSFNCFLSFFSFPFLLLSFFFSSEFFSVVCSEQTILISIFGRFASFFVCLFSCFFLFLSFQVIFFSFNFSLISFLFFSFSFSVFFTTFSSFIFLF